MAAVPRQGQVIIGRLFSEPMRIETAAQIADGTWRLGLVGLRSERFRSVTLSSEQLDSLEIREAIRGYRADGRLLRLGLQSTDVDRNSKAETRNSEEPEDEEVEAEDEEGAAGKAKKGYTLIYDVVRRFAQPLGIHLENWEGRAIEIKKGVVRLIPVLEREEQIFGTSGTHAVARALERTGGRDAQYALPYEGQPARPARGRQARRSRGKEEAEAMAARREATTLDRVHAAMILQARGEATALRALLEAEIERSPDFLRLANALSALYPKDSEEKRLLDAMLLAAPR